MPAPRPAPQNWPDGLILFDGVCVLCSASVRRVIARDSARRFSFASMQSPFGSRLAGAIGQDPGQPDSVAVALGGKVLFKSDAALAIMTELDGLGWTRILKLAPRPLRDWLYDRVARNRYRLFGKRHACFLPSPQDRARFLDDGPQGSDQGRGPA